MSNYEPAINEKNNSFINISSRHVSRDFGIDLVRVIGILYIIGYWHIFNYTDPFPIYNNFVTDLITRIILAVLTLISGFYAASSYHGNTLNFYKKKLLRIYPLYLVAIVVFVILRITNISTACYAILSLSMFKEPAPHTLWFVSMIIIFYFITPFLLNVMVKLNIKFLILVSATFLLLLYIHESITGLLDIRMLMYFPSYVFGLILSNRKIKLNHFFGLSTILPLFFLVCVKDSNIISIVKVPFITYIAIVLFCWGKEYRFSSKRLIHIVEVLSYSTWCMYLFHRPVYTLLVYFVRPVGFYYQLTLLLFIGLPFTNILAYLLQYIYDLLYKKVITKS